MKIKQLIKSLDTLGKNTIKDNFEVRGISCNSKAVKEDFVFVAVKGDRQDGSKFIDEAVANGARAVITQSSRNGKPGLASVPLLKVRDTRSALARLAVEFYGEPSSKLKVVGITGTNGKLETNFSG